MAYLKTWLLLEEAVAQASNLVGAANTDEIRADLCQMVADGKMHVRVTTAAGHVFDGLHVYVPKHLNPTDFDWPNSRPTSPWFVGLGASWKMASGQWSEAARPIQAIEVRADDLKLMASVPYKTGVAGRPTSWGLVESELRRRHDAGKFVPPQPGDGRIAALAGEMQRWLKETHPSASQPKSKTLQNRLAPLLAQFREQSMKR